MTGIGGMVVLFLLMIAPDHPGQDHPPTNGPDAAVDCGTSSLYTMMRLEGFEIPFDDLCGRMVGGTNRSHSLKELRDVARSNGLALRGVKLENAGLDFDRPALVYLDRKPHGHFVVVRPVGHSGTMVQMIDPNLSPVVMDATRLYAMPDWTGLALMPGRTDWFLMGSIACASVALAIVVGSLVSHRRRVTRSVSREVA